MPGPVGAVAGKIGRLPADEQGVSPPSDQMLQRVWDESAADLSRLVCAMGVGRECVEDVLQDVYLAAWRHGPLEAGQVDLRRWLFKTAANRCRLEHRRRRRWQSLLKTVAFWRSTGRAVPQPEQTASSREEHQLVRTALDGLRPHLRLVLILRYYLDWDSSEIGRVLEIPSSTVRSQLRTARKHLADALIQSGYSDE